MQDRNDAPELPRREFLKRVGVAGLAVSIVGADALAAAVAPGTPAAAPPPVAAPARPDSLAAPAPPSEDARALAGILERRFPNRLTPEQWDGVTSSLDQRLESGKRLRSARLANGDEPDFAFKA